MIIRKLAVPLINDKILQQALHCYIATSSISEAGFEFLRSRVPPKTKIDIVTGLHELTSPSVLEKILRHYQGRINLNLYTKGILNANVYVFDLPFRKSVAFVGSGSFSLEGFKDQEELFWKITDPKDVESLLSWYTSFFQFGMPLTEKLFSRYSSLYPVWKDRKVITHEEKEELLRLTTGPYNYETIKFRNQFFQKEHYLTFAVENAGADNASLRLQREAVSLKLNELDGLLTPELKALRIKTYPDRAVTSIDPSDRRWGRIRSLGICFTKEKPTDGENFLTYQLHVSVLGVSLRFIINGGKTWQTERELNYVRLEKEPLRSELFALISTQLRGYSFEVAGIKKSIESLVNPAGFFEFMRSGIHASFPMVFEKVFLPGDPALAEANIVSTLVTEFEKIEPVSALIMKQ